MTPAGLKRGPAVPGRAVRRAGWAAAGAVAPVAFVLLWEQASSAGLLDPTFVPAPSRVWRALDRLWASGELGEAAATTLTRMLYGWAVGGVIGVALGTLTGRSRALREALQPTFEFMRSIPAAAVVPAAVLLVGVGAAMEVAVVAFASTWPVLVNTAAGVRGTEPLLLDVGRVYGLSRWRQALSISLPSAVPGALVGLRISLAVSLIVAVIAEMVASDAGLGNLVIQARSRFRVADVYAVVVVLGAVGLVVNGFVGRLEAGATRWQRAGGAAPSRGGP